MVAHVHIAILAASQPLQDAQLGPLDAQRLHQPYLLHILSKVRRVRIKRAAS
jgi:hypothetical protein